MGRSYQPLGPEEEASVFAQKVSALSLIVESTSAEMGPLLLQ